jgi:mono/diheme cytochrome c family protein
MRVLGVLILTSLAAAGFAQEPWTAPKEEAKRANPVPSSPEALQKGRALFQRHCASCHGPKGKGDGAGVGLLAGKTNRRPADLSDARVQGALSDGEVFWKVANGLKEGAVVVMPAYATEIPKEDDRWTLIHFLRTLKEPR